MMDIKKILFKTKSIDVEKALPDGVAFCHKDGKIAWVNDKLAELFETSKIHLLTSNINDFIENALNLIMTSVVSSAPVITKFNDKDIFFDMTASEIEDGYVLDFRDSVPGGNLKQELDEELDNAINRDKNNFIVNLSNDFTAPLQSIVGFSQAMADGLGGQMSEQQDKYIKIIKKNASELMYFIEKFVQFSKTESNLGEPSLKIFDLLNTVNTIVKYNEQLMKDKEIRWSVSIAEGLSSRINSDENIIKTVMQNIVEVIVKSIEIGDVSVNISLPDEDLLKEKNINNPHILISVSSNSFLLSENELDCLFEPYKIVESSNRKNVLRAITLASIKNLIQQLRGYVWVESKILKNTTFNILIPSNN